MIGGHLVTTLVGLAVLKLTGPQAWAAAARGRPVDSGDVFDGTFHPPAGIDPAAGGFQQFAVAFLLAPVLAGALLLAAFAYVWHRWLRRQPWPQRWL